MDQKRLTARNAALWSKIPLRERSRAKTRLALLDATLSQMQERAFADIRAADVARAAGVSEATFFNHFGSKGDLLLYFVQLWSIEVGSKARAFEPDGGGLAAIERVFAITAEQLSQWPRVMAEVVAHQATAGRPEAVPEVSAAERIARFPECDGVDALPARGIDAIIERNLRRAVELGELPRHADLETLSLAIASVFLGTPAALGPALHPQLDALWRLQLALLWRGARATTDAPPTEGDAKRKKRKKQR